MSIAQGFLNGGVGGASKAAQRKIAMWAIGGVISGLFTFLGFGATVTAETFHILEKHIERSFTGGACGEVTSGSPEVAKLCKPNTPLRDRIKGWASTKLKNGWTAVKEKFGVGSPSPTTLDETKNAQGTDVAAKELQSSTDPNKAPPTDVAADYAAEGDLAPPVASDAGVSPTIVEGEPGSTTASGIAEAPADAKVAAGANTPAEVVGEAADGGGVNLDSLGSKVISAGKAAISKLATTTIKAVFNKTSFAFVIAGVALAIVSSNIATAQRRAEGASYWTPQHGDTNWAIQNCQTQPYLAYITTLPGSALGEPLFWQWNPGLPNNNETYKTLSGNTLTVTAPKMSDYGLEYGDLASGAFPTISSAGKGGAVAGGNINQCSQYKNLSTLAEKDNYISQWVNGGKTGNTQILGVNAAFQKAEGQSFYTAVHNPTTINLAQAGIIQNAPVPMTTTLYSVYIQAGNAASSIVSLPSAPALAQSLCGSPDLSCPLMNQNLTALQNAFTNAENQLSSDIKSNNSASAQAADAKQLADLQHKEGVIEAAFPDGADIIATLLTTKDAKGNPAVRTNSLVYQEMVNELAGNAACYTQGNCVKDSAGNILPNNGAYMNFKIVAQQARHSATAAAINLAIGQARDLCNCESLFPPTFTGAGGTNIASTSTDPTVPSNEYIAMMMSLTDIIGNYGVSYDSTGAEVQTTPISPMGNQGVVGLLPSQFTAGISVAATTSAPLGSGTAASAGGTTDMGVSDQYTAASMLLMKDLRDSNGDILGAFEAYVRQNNLPPMDGRWGSDGTTAVNDGWGYTVTTTGGTTGHISTAALLATAYNTYLSYFQAATPSFPQDSSSLNIAGYGFPAAVDMNTVNGLNGYKGAAAAFHLDPGVLYAMGNNASDFADNPLVSQNSNIALCSIQTEVVPNKQITPDGKPPTADTTNGKNLPWFWPEEVAGGPPNGTSTTVPPALVGKTIPSRYGIMGLTPMQFVAGYNYVNLHHLYQFPADTLTPLPIGGSCPNFGEPTGMLNSQTEVWAAAGYVAQLRDSWNIDYTNPPPSLSVQLGGSASFFQLNSHYTAYTNQTYATAYQTPNDNNGQGLAVALTGYFMGDDYSPDGLLASGVMGGGGPIQLFRTGPGDNTPGNNPTAGTILDTAVADFPGGTQFTNDVWPPASSGSVLAGIAVVVGIIAITAFCPGVCDALLGAVEVGGYLMMAKGAVDMARDVISLANQDLSSNTQKLQETLSTNIMSAVGKMETLTLVDAPVYDLWATGKGQDKPFSTHFILPPVGSGVVSGNAILQGQPAIPQAYIAAFQAAATKYDVPLAFLSASAAQEDTSMNPAPCSADKNANGSPNSYGMFQMQPGTFTSNGTKAGLASTAFTPLSNTGTCPNWGEPAGEMDPNVQVNAAAYMLHALGATGAATTAQLLSAAYHYNAGGAAAPGIPSATAYANSVVNVRYPIYQNWIAAGMPLSSSSTLVGYGSTGAVFWRATIAYGQPAPILWAGVGGKTDDPFGQCTWFSQSNFYTELGGNGGQMYGAARTAGLPTVPGNSPQPPVIGSLISWNGPGYASSTGHTAIVVYVDPAGKYYIVAEANYTSEVTSTQGFIDLRKVSFPDAQLTGSVPPKAAVTPPNFGDLLQVIANGGIPPKQPPGPGVPA